MPQPQSALADFPDPDEPRSGESPAACVERLRQETAGLRAEQMAWQEERRAWQEEKIAAARAASHDRQQAGYYQSMHARALQRLLEKDQQSDALKAKVAEFTHRVFGRNSERSKAPRHFIQTTPRRIFARGISPAELW